MTFEEDFETHCSERSKKILGLNLLDPVEISKKYFDKGLNGTTIDHNANVDSISPNNYFSEIAKPGAKLYFLKRFYEVGKQMYRDFSLKHYYDGHLYIHDSTKLQPYCWGTSMSDIVQFGRPHSSLIALPPKSLFSFMGQATEYIMELSQQFAGAIAVTDLVPWMVWFVYKGKPDEYIGYFDDSCGEYFDKEIENVFQSFVHVLNNNFRVGGDSPFTNISVNSKAVYEDIFKDYVFTDEYTEETKTIEDLWPTIDRIQRMIVEFMSKGQSNGLPYRFPILTANFKTGEKGSEWFNFIGKKNKTGFMNVSFSEKFSMCCRLSLDLDVKQNSFGGGGIKVGSMRVINLNLPLICREMEWKKNLRYYTIEAIKYLKVYRELFKDLIKSGYLTFFKEPTRWFDISMFFGTVGFCGIWDASCLKSDNLEGKMDFMIDVVVLLVSWTKLRSTDEFKINVEEVPSESAAGTMAKLNQYDDKAYYSNQFIPLQENVSLDRRIKCESFLQSQLTGGGMTFLNFDAPLTEEQSLRIHETMSENDFTGQFCINYGYTICGDCNSLTYGIKDKCDCGSTNTNSYTRVVGYLAEVHNTAESKTKEIKEREYY